MIILGAGANALASFPGFTIVKAWEQAYERTRVASRKMFRGKSGRAKALLALPLAPALYTVYHVLLLLSFESHTLAYIGRGRLMMEQLVSDWSVTS